MPIQSLSIQKFRNILSADLTFSPGFNFIIGENGAGKTSLLEAIYYLGFNRSFRTTQIPQIIKFSELKFTLFCVSEGHKVGLERDRNGQKALRIDGESVSSFSESAKIFPLQFLGTDAHRLFHDGPKERRQLMDWGTFHVEPSFLGDWQRFQRALKQRNALLKAYNHQDLPSLKEQLAPWDFEFREYALKVHKARLAYAQAIEPIFQALMQKLLPSHSEELSTTYSPGWNLERDLLEILEHGLPRDVQIGFTQAGPQKSDLQFEFQGIPLQHHFSQGQQKLTAYGFQIAQGLLVKQAVHRTPIFLIDDLSSELDVENRARVLKALIEIEAQCFIAEIEWVEDGLVPVEGRKMFHVKHGVVEVSHQKTDNLGAEHP